MREWMSIHLGKAGVELGDMFWELYALEHSLSANGTIVVSEPNAEHLIFTHESAKGKYIPRALFVDLSNDAIDHLRTGPRQQLYAPHNFVHGLETSAGIYARGRYVGKTALMEECSEQIRHSIEQCTGPSGFFLSIALAGGTSSGLASLLLEHLNVEYGKKSRICLDLVSTGSAVEVYNSILCYYTLIENADLNLMFEFQALRSVCKYNLLIAEPTLASIDDVMTHAIAGALLPLSYDSATRVDITECLSLNPYPRLNQRYLSYCPLIGRDKSYHDPLSINDLTEDSFSPSSTLVHVDHNDNTSSIIFM